MSERIQNMRDIQHFGEEGGVVPVIDVAATSTFLNPLDMEKAFHGELEGCYLYSRHSNPSVSAFGKKFAALEGTEAALGVSSGMAAIHAVLDQWVSSGEHIVASRTIYGGTWALFKNLLPRRGITVSFVDINDLAAVEAAIEPSTRAIFTETLSNPILNMSDLSSLGELSKKHGLKLVVDNTFTPVLVTPVDHGADAVIHSCTKYISGASDLIAGVIAGSSELVHSLTDILSGSVMLTGPVMDSRIAHELYLRLDHLPVRMAAHSHHALTLARRMEESGIPVFYPGLETHPQHELMTRHLNPGYGYGGMLTIDCGTAKKAMELARELQEVKFGLYAVSLGFSRTLMSCPSVSTSSEIPESEQKRMRLSPGLLRLSIGFTGTVETAWDRFISTYRKVFKNP
ncbi:MAG: aminotransferase class I/II-fold pyridoxal phosphate-dependent enzyme [Proteobacteria bacterium]|nr:aminotransferase class I/II-fold pyridoxal phosphate-dependent enzyme [Pseudomonadota bacterium]